MNISERILSRKKLYKSYSFLKIDALGRAKLCADDCKKISEENWPNL
jgi:hypothetical protein